MVERAAQLAQLSQQCRTAKVSHTLCPEDPSR